MKICLKCKEEKPSEEYRKDCKSKDGYYRICKACVSDREKAAYANRDNTRVLEQCKTRRDVAYQIMYDYKLNHPCDCGETHPVALAFHHEEDKDFGLSYARSLSINRILEEIKKCKVVCHNCHAKIHAGIITL